MTGPVLKHLGEVRLELGAAQDANRQGAWRSATDVHGIQWLALDAEGTGTNTISRGVLEGLNVLLDRIEAKPPKGLVLRSAKTGGFAAGADISMFRDMTDQDEAKAMLEQGHAVLDRLESLDCPTVCVVHGHALGAGFELALACDRIIAVEGASFGFPEVRLGLHPGLGGTFRLTERIDPIKAMTLMLTGKTAYTAKAEGLGIVDLVTEERHVEAAVHAAIDGELSRAAPGLTGRAMSLSTARSLAARKMRQKAQEDAPAEHYPAPHALIDLWEEHGDSRTEMQSGEIASFVRLLSTETSQNLVRVFFLQQQLKDAGRGSDDIKHVHVIGAGTMGAEIAAWCAVKGKSVTLSDPDIEALSQSVVTACRICEEEHLNSLETRDVLDRLMPDPDRIGVARADLVIEVGPEDAEIKAQIYAEIEPQMNPVATLATNTSSLSLIDLAKTLKRPSRFAGLHFFNPVAKMQLVEVVSHPDTFQTVTDQLAAFCGAIGRLPARIGDYPGFLVNRALTPYLLEAIRMIDEGHDKETIDHAAEVFGMPVGPVELADRVGLDICLHVADSLRSGLEKPIPEVPGWLRDQVNDKGDTGKKSGKGLYVWRDGEAQKTTTRPPKPDDDMTDRLILPMLDACVECLRKGVVKDEDVIDAAMIFATGFAPFRGGPMHYARTRGAQDIHQRLHDLAAAHGDRFQPDPGWADLR
ncbi:fatty-acid oxidation protein subunit alpha [Pseudohalocynthiibacter aestuariivivens]|nr:3-hydroxyacyl-CoA dehydrogenase NAD-binding domain-containing protein [Pseudohalocynthiibacter aestuariivivens]QIE46706.1 fatty-acid oxidation protein subunit alpha [Pseudohalocynthiibacter aestuariivivens]